MNRINMGQENEKEEGVSVWSLAYFLNSEVRHANHLQNVGSLIHNPVADYLLVPY